MRGVGHTRERNPGRVKECRGEGEDGSQAFRLPTAGSATAQQLDLGGGASRAFVSKGLQESCCCFSGLLRRATEGVDKSLKGGAAILVISRSQPTSASSNGSAGGGVGGKWANFSGP